LPVRGSR